MPRRLSVAVGDVLWFVATGVRIQSGGNVVQMLGPFMAAFLGPAGQIVSPQGPPSSVFVLARAPGQATIEIITGDPWSGSRTTAAEVIVEP